MEFFLSTLNQLAFLFSLIVAGYVISKLKVVGGSAAGTLSKLENTLFIPALVLGTFIDNFTVESLSSARKILLISFLVAIVFITLSIITSRLIIYPFLFIAAARFIDMPQNIFMHFNLAYHASRS